MLTIEQIRNIHNNEYKRTIIRDAYVRIPYRTPAQRQTSVLDLSCGTGGDLHKYYHSNYKKVYAVDISTFQLQEAESLYNNVYVKTHKNIYFDVSFMQYDLRQSTKKVPFFDNIIHSGGVDVIVMNFALHYFFENETCLANLLSTVSRCLKPDGLFVGVNLDGERLKEVHRLGLINDNDRQLFEFDIYDENTYTFRLLGDQKYFKNLESQKIKNVEYFVNLNTLKQQAENVALELIQYRHFSNDKNINKILYFDFSMMFRKRSSDSSSKKKTTTSSSSSSKTKNVILTNDELQERNIRKHLFFVKDPNRSFIDYDQLQLTSMSLFSSTQAKASLFWIKFLFKLWNRITSTTVINRVIDGTANIGTDTVTLALYCNHVTGIELDPVNFEALTHNIRNVYQFDMERVSLINDDVMIFLDHQLSDTYDVLYLDVPWNYDEYKRHLTQGTRQQLYLNDIELSRIIKKVDHIVSIIVLKVPVTFDLDDFYNNIQPRKMIVKDFFVGEKERRKVLMKFLFITK